MTDDSRPTARSPAARDDRAQTPAAAAPAPRAVSPWSLLLGGALLVALLFGQWVWLVAILGLALLITVHEFGHFIAAKAFGMRVEKFYVGFPPAALRRTWGETEYGIGIIPLGGFCKISGMLPEEDVPDGTGDRVYYKKAIWKRNLTIAAGPLMNFAAAAVILVLFVGIQGVATATLTLDEVVKDAPAARAGLVAGDTLVGADGQTWTTWDEASAYFRANPGKTISLVYEPKAGGPEKTVQLTLVENPQAPGSGYLGVRAGVSRERPGPVEAVRLGLSGFGDVVVGTFTGFWWLLSGKISATGPDGAVGPVGIIDVSRQAVQQNWYPILLAFLSFNLGLINLLPILPFDGGHIAMNVVERIRGRRLDTRVFERLVAFGTVLLVMLFIFLTFNDVKRLFGG
ncbi:MAG: M50 family metallopeptidase [Deltaproteobacteria bacterium]